MGMAEDMLREDVENNRAIGAHGCAAMLKHSPNGDKLRVLTHCNTGKGGIEK